MKKIITPLIIFMCFTKMVNSQTIATDSKNKTVFTVVSKQKTRVDFSGNDFSLTIQSKPISSLYHSLTTGLLGFSKDDKNRSNVSKTTVGYITLSMLNASKILSLTDIKDFKPGIGIKIGAQRNVDSIFTNYHGASWGGGFNLFGSMDNIKLYNTDNGTIGKEYPLSYGAEANLVFFPKATGKRKLIVFADLLLTNGWNDASLLNYKDISSSLVTPTVVAFDKFDGKYGQLITNINKARLAISAPITTGIFSPTPYLVVNAVENDYPTSLVGVFLNFFSEKVDFKTFKIPSGLGIGIDWSKKGSDWSSGNIFIRGSIQIGKL